MPSLTVYHADVPKIRPLREIVGANVKAIRTAKKMSQPQVVAAAKQYGAKIDQTTVGRIERAAVPTTIDTLQSLALGLGVEPWQLLVHDLDTENLPKLGAGTVANDELELLQKYRASSGRWKISLRYMAGLKEDSEQEEVAEGVNVLVAKILGARAFPSERMGSGWTRPDRRDAVHEAEAIPYPPQKRRKT